MTVRELIEKLEEFGDHIEVKIVVPGKLEDKLFDIRVEENLEHDPKTGDEVVGLQLDK